MRVFRNAQQRRKGTDRVRWTGVRLYFRLPDRKAFVSWISTLVFLVGSLTVSLHGAQAIPPLNPELAQLQLALGEPADAILASICHHDDDGSSTPHQRDDGNSCQKTCFLCQLLQHSEQWPAQASANIIPLLSTAIIKLGPDNPVQAGGLTESEQRRPRAPPIA